jgi:hypothetical protein
MTQYDKTGLWMNAFTWTPDNYVENSRFGSANIAKWDCNINYHPQMHVEVWVAVESTEKCRGRFSLLGIGLNSWQTNGASETLRSDLVTGKTFQRLCGSDASISDASYILEAVPRRES